MQFICVLLRPLQYTMTEPKSYTNKFPNFPNLGAIFSTFLPYLEKGQGNELITRGRLSLFKA